MHPRSVLAIARKDAIDILLNKSTVGVLIAPILLALFFLLVTKLLGGQAVNVLVYNPGQSRLVQVVSSSFNPVKVTEADSPADVSSAFGPNGSTKDAAYDVGLIIPANFESALQAGQHPPVNLYLNGNKITAQNSLLIQAAIVNYARQVASPRVPIALSTTMINPPSQTSLGDILGSIYGATALLVSFMVGTYLMPGLLIEEKEKKTLRMLMVTPASFTDVILGKLLVVLVYQLLLSAIVLAIQGGFRGQISLVLLYTLLGSCFSLALGLLFGGIFSTASTAGAVNGIVSFIFIIPGIFIGYLGQMLGNGLATQAMKILPTYYLADGAYNAMQGQGSLSSNLIDIGILLGSTLVLLAITVWVLRRQASVAAAI
jgi:ABC-2 type transport system permease protein